MYALADPREFEAWTLSGFTTIALLDALSRLYFTAKLFQLPQRRTQLPARWDGPRLTNLYEPLRVQLEAMYRVVLASGHSVVLANYPFIKSVAKDVDITEDSCQPLQLSGWLLRNLIATHRCFNPGCLTTRAHLGRNMHICTGCDVANYCSRDCQRTASWKHVVAPHKQVCCLLKQANAARLVRGWTWRDAGNLEKEWLTGDTRSAELLICSLDVIVNERWRAEGALTVAFDSA